MAKEWGEGYIESIRRHFAGLVHPNERGEPVISMDSAPMALWLSTIKKLDDLTVKINRVSVHQIEILANQKKIMTALDELKKPQELKGKSVKPPKPSH